ncbi:MAG: hypothetical protein ACLSVY_06580, partial [Ruminococcus callidus]
DEKFDNASVAQSLCGIALTLCRYAGGQKCSPVLVYKETLNKARLTALHAICVQIFRHIAQKSLARHTVCLRNFCVICRKI